MNYEVEEFQQKILQVQLLAGSRSLTAVGPWVAGSLFYPLDHEVLVDRIISEIRDVL